MEESRDPAPAPADPPPAGRVALFGGTFDPPHTAHVAVANAAVRACRLDRIVFLPCRISPHKSAGAPTASAADRLAMLRLAVAGIPNAEISTWDLDRPDPVWSWQTAAHFADSLPAGTRLFWLMGADQWAALDRWARPDVLASLVEFIVFPRDGHRPEPQPDRRATFLDAEFPGSSTEIRRLLAQDLPADRLLPPPVAEYIRRHRLYRSPATDGGGPMEKQDPE